MRAIIQRQTAPIAKYGRISRTAVDSFDVDFLDADSSEVDSPDVDSPDTDFSGSAWAYEGAKPGGAGLGIQLPRNRPAMRTAHTRQRIANRPSLPVNQKGKVP